MAGLYVWISKEAETGLLPLYLQVPFGERQPPAGKYETILQWGALPRDAEGTYVLNPYRSVLRAKHEKSARELLSVNGMKTDRSMGRMKQFRVPVFHLDALSIWERKRSPALVATAAAGRKDEESSRVRRMGSRSSREDSIRSSGRPIKRLSDAFPEGDRGLENADWGDFRELHPDDQSSFHVRRAKREAVRAIYALGLVSGLVHIGIDPAGRTMVDGVDPAPALNDRLSELFADAIERYAEELGRDRETKGPVVLGADPEFLLQNQEGKIVPASRYMEREGTVGCDAVVLPDRSIILPLAELRPAPNSDPYALVRELRRNMRQAARMIGDGTLAWLAGSMPVKGLPLGGHVHLSGIGLHERLLRALDNYVALPLVLAEGVSAGSRKPRYGFLGDFRRKRHGGFEYRSLPSWLSSPELALSVLALVETVAVHVRELGQRPLDRMDIQRAYYKGNKEELLPVVRECWRELEAMPNYEKYRSVLDAFRDRIFRFEGWDELADFRASWKITPQ